MNNWVTFLIVNVVLVIVLGILTNLATPWVKSAYERSIFSSRKRRIERLIKDYEFILFCRKNSFFLLTILITYVATLVVIAAIAILSALSPANPSPIFKDTFLLLLNI